MTNKTNKANKAAAALIKIVYFDEQSASDYLDISAGGTTTSKSEQVQKRGNEMQAKLSAGIAARMSWLPFLGASAEASAEIGVSSVGQSLMSKTLSNTILTDYLEKVENDERVQQLRALQVTAPEGSMAFMKMYTPYMVMTNTADTGIDLARMDEALERAKGYYELLAEGSDGSLSVLRFNIRAFRNNYGLADLQRMQLVFHGVRVGCTIDTTLSMQAEMSGRVPRREMTVEQMIDDAPPEEQALEVFDVLLAGVEHVG